jgi:hypothetical protein
MQFSAYDQAILDMTVARNIDVTNTPYDPEWASSQTNLTVRTQMRNVGFDSFSSKRAFFEAYPSLRDYKQDFFNVAVEFRNEEVALAMYEDGALINGPPNTPPDSRPFTFALRRENLSMIRWMLSLPDLDVNVTVDDMNATSFAIQERMPDDIIQSMVQRGALNNPLGQWYPLSMALSICHCDNRLIQLLLFYGADPHFIDDDQHDCGYYAWFDYTRDAIRSWSDQATQTLRQMVGNNLHLLYDNHYLWKEALDRTNQQANNVDAVEVRFQTFNIN